MPILWHIMKTYAHYGFKEFILCLGYKGNVIKEYFYNYEMLSNDFKIHPRHLEHGWKITLVDTRLNTLKGSVYKTTRRVYKR